MADEESVRRRRTMIRWLGVILDMIARAGGRHLLISAVGFRAEFQPAGGRLVTVLLLLLALERAVEEGAFIVATDLAVGDGHILARPRFAQGIGALEADAVVPRGVDRAIGDANIAAGV